MIVVRKRDVPDVAIDRSEAPPRFDAPCEHKVQVPDRHQTRRINGHDGTPAAKHGDAGNPMAMAQDVHSGARGQVPNDRVVIDAARHDLVARGEDPCDVDRGSVAPKLAHGLHGSGVPHRRRPAEGPEGEHALAIGEHLRICEPAPVEHAEPLAGERVPDETHTDTASHHPLAVGEDVRAHRRALVPEPMEGLAGCGVPNDRRPVRAPRDRLVAEGEEAEACDPRGVAPEHDRRPHRPPQRHRIAGAAEGDLVAEGQEIQDVGGEVRCEPRKAPPPRRN
mmetsp:Transcript_73817/g.204506  ORF Transcript_73817/g.204506 Transcript_73817/m.204506 type:complete len:279 (+) Transcript_73817:370-1206(+)